jgi:hypothetical protein
MGSVQRQGPVVVVTRSLILRNERKQEGAGTIQGPERVEPGLVNIRIRGGLKRVFLKKARMSFFHSRFCKVEFTRDLSKRFILCGP